jgi:class 3 adenylate cyclase
MTTRDRAICARRLTVMKDAGGVVDEGVTQYLKTSDGASFAYAIFGNGALDLVVLNGIPLPIDLLWDDLGLVRCRDRLSAFSRNIWVEFWGWGASDRKVDAEADLDESHTDELLNEVLNATACQQVVLVGCSGRGPEAIRFAAAHPERVSALILVEAYASFVRDEKSPWGMPIGVVNDLDRWVETVWGTGAMVEVVAPSRSGDERFREWLARGERLGSAPRDAGRSIRALAQRDVRPLLSALEVPTLVLHRRDDRFVRVGAGRYLAEHIDGAKYVELPGSDHWFFAGDSDAILDEVEEFLTGVRTGPEGDTVVSTVLFTDIVDSTSRAAAAGRATWSKVCAEHDALVRAALLRHRGQEIKTMGDGFLATFDSAGRAIRCAAEIVSGAQDIGIDVRAGVHTGEIEFRHGDVHGLAVNIGKRVCDLAPAGQIFVTETVRGATIGSSIKFDGAGEHTLKGVPGTWRLHMPRATAG